jgi:type II secretory pathway pseudopilin PulG
MKPRRYYQVDKNSFEVLFNEAANVFNFLVLEFQRLVFAENVSHTVIACVLSFISYKLVRYIPLWALALIATVMAFTLPPLYLHNQKLIDKHIAQAQALAAQQAQMARDTANHHIGVATEHAKAVTSDWGKKAGIELPWSPSKTKTTTTQAPVTAGPSTNVGGSAPAATGISSLAGLNVPQTTPQKKVDPTKVPLPDTPAPAPVVL